MIFVENSAHIKFLMGSHFWSMPKEEGSTMIIAFCVPATHIEHYEMSVK